MLPAMSETGESPPAAPSLTERLGTLPNLSGIPRQEVEWLVEHGTLRVFEPGAVVGPKGEPIDTLWVILSGLLSVRVDRGVGPRRVIEWTPGELSGMLPYSRMTAPPGDVHPLRCPACHGEMRILAFLTDPGVVRPILHHLRIPEHPPPVAPARGPPQTELLAHDPPSPWDTEHNPPPGGDPFDQSLPGDDGIWSA
jgi:hypothetical protein